MKNINFLTFIKQEKIRKEMKRKIIGQGKGGLTIYIPRKWADKKGLKIGDEIEVKEGPEGLMIIPEKIKKQKTSITVKIQKSRESAIRTVLVNAYRAGFDVINLKYLGNEKEVYAIVHTFLLGFDVFHKEKQEYTIENMSEPSGENFENIFIKQLYLLEQVLGNFLIRDITQETHKIQRYDHFLKRCLSKESSISPIAGNFFIWQFLSHVTQTARLCLHMQKQLGFCQKEIEANQMLQECLQTIREMTGFLKKAYLKEDIAFLREIHEADEKILRKREQLFQGENPDAVHQILSIERSLYLANSPLMGLLQIRSFAKKS